MKTILFIFSIALFGLACTQAGTDDNYKAANPDSDITGSPPNPAIQGSAFSISTDAYYQGEFEPVSKVKSVMSLWLKPTFEAEMTTVTNDSRAPVIETGTWKTLENGNLFLELKRVGSSDSSRLEFKTDGEKLIYTGTDDALNGFTLWVKPVPGRL